MSDITHPLYFSFDSTEWQEGSPILKFHYRFVFEDQADLLFCETIELPKPLDIQKIPQSLWETLLENLHIILGISYYKLYCPKDIKLSYTLTAEQARFWTKVYRKGLGELCYRNKLNLDGIVHFQKSTDDFKQLNWDLNLAKRTLAGIGGGKDSIVSVEILKEIGQIPTAFLVQTQKPSEQINTLIEKLEIDSLVIKRFLDPKIFQTHEGSFNGHIPISAILAFLGITSGILYDYQYIAVGNESSSNVGNVEYQGEVVNHQWSKSVEFESELSEYVRQFISPDIHYFSILRPFSELKIVELFSQYPQYFPYFTSCNRTYKINETRENKNWCGQCAKCCFVFTLLSVYVKKETLLNLFGKNLFEDISLILLFTDLLGLGTVKPWDCVGTFEEMQVAFDFAAKNTDYQNDPVITSLIDKISVKKEDIVEVMKTNPAPLIPTEFAFAGMRSVAILGYGIEGKETEKYLGDKKIGILDQSLDPNYLDKQTDYDLVIKTPGIPRDKVTVAYTTALNLFFAKIKELGNFTIGVTGSKGKSTTASLIAAVCRASGKPTQLVGNIGVPALSILTQDLTPDTIIVMELSSYMLEDCHYSPNIAVCVSLFPEHMNYHGSLENYYLAKKNIGKFQHQTDKFIFNPKYPELIEWSKQFSSQAIPFDLNIDLANFPSNLLGQHNQENIQGVITVARTLGISDDAIKNALANFHSLPHRLEFVGEFKGIKFYDDAISTTPESTIAALNAIPNVATIFLGGQDRGYDFSQIEETLLRLGIQNVVLFPESGEKMIQNKSKFNILKTFNMQEAVGFAYKNTPVGKTVLLSTASPSYSVWKNFEAKGDEFKKWVKEF